MWHPVAGCRLPVAGRERQNVGGLVDAAEVAIEATDIAIAHEGHGNGALRLPRGDALQPSREAAGGCRTARSVRQGDAEARSSGARSRLPAEIGAPRAAIQRRRSARHVGLYLSY